MRKTLAVVVVFGVALLVASPAQAKPVKQRAANAALCLEALLTAGEPVKSVSPIDFTPAELVKCWAVINRHVAWVKRVYPSQSQVDVFSETELEAIYYEQAASFVRAYRVSSTQIVNAIKRLRSK